MSVTIGQAVYQRAILESDYGYLCWRVLQVCLDNRPRIDPGEWMIGAQERIDDHRRDCQVEIGHTLPAITIDVGSEGYFLSVEYPFTPQPCTEGETYEESHHRPE